MPKLKSERKWNLKFFLFLDISYGKWWEYRKDILNELPKVKYILETYQVENEFLGYCDQSYNKYENLGDVQGAFLGLIFGVDVNLGYMYVVQMIKHLMRQKNMRRELEIKNILKHASVMLYPEVFTYDVNAFSDLIKSLYLCGVKYDYERLRYKLYGQDIDDLFKKLYTKNNGLKTFYSCLKN